MVVSSFSLFEMKPCVEETVQVELYLKLLENRVLNIGWSRGKQRDKDVWELWNGMGFARSSSCAESTSIAQSASPK